MNWFKDRFKYRREALLYKEYIKFLLKVYNSSSENKWDYKVVKTIDMIRKQVGA